MRRCAALLALVAALARAQDAPQQPAVLPPQPLAAAADLEARLAQVQSNTALDAALKQALIDALAEALSRTRDASASRERAERIRREASDAPAEIAAIDAELARPPLDDLPDPGPDATLTVLEQSFAQAQAERQGAADRLAAIREQIRTRIERNAALPTLLARQRELVAAPVEPPPSEDPPSLSEARRLLAEARAEANRTELATLETELAAAEARATLLQRREDQAQRRLGQHDRRVAAWQELVVARRQLDAERAAADARRAREEAARQHPVVREITTRSAALSELRAGARGVVQRQADADAALALTLERTRSLRDDYQRTRRRVQLLGVPQALGQALRRERERLPATDDIAARIAAHKVEASSIGLLLIDLEEQRTAAADPDAELRRRLDPDPGADVRTAARDLLVAQRRLLDDLARDYARFIDERILWVRSTSPISSADLAALPEATAGFVTQPAWARAIRMPTPRAWAFLLLAALSLAFRRSGHRAIERLARRVASVHTDAWAYSFHALLISITLALPVPALLLAAARLIDTPASSLPQGLTRAAAYWFFAASFRNILAPSGLAQAHFRWNADACALIRRTLRVIMPLGLPLVITVSTLDRSDDSAARDSLGRLALVVALALVSWAAWRLFRASSPLRTELARVGKGSIADRTRFLWHPVLVLSPIALSVIALLGYSYTALVLSRRLQITLGIVIALFVVSGMIQRVFFVARRRLALLAAMEKRAAAKGETTPEPALAPDVARIGAQTRTLLRTFSGAVFILGFYLAWADVLPALGRLDHVRLWPSIAIVNPDEAVPPAIATPPTTAATSPATTPAAPPATTPASSSASDAAAAQPVSPVNRLPLPQTPDAAPDSTGRVITLADLLLALTILVATAIFGTNVAGLLELTILPRLPLDAGVRYAVLALTRYTITILGIVIAFSTLGIGWSSIQWLAAALTFGLAFGLQEIFANFVSGIIIFFERPIRVGDTVTVRDVSGTVNRIQMRATTIVTWDRREFIVPNREFITGSITNWTLTDPVSRIIIPVGVDYTADPRRVRDLLLACALDNPAVLREPPPGAPLLSFGDNALQFELRVFVAHVDLGVRVRDELNVAIHKALTEAGLAIPYPQRDVHLRVSGPGLPVVVTHPSANEPAPATPPSP